MVIYEVTDPEFREYGRIIEGIDFSEFLEALDKTPCPEDGTVYVAGDPELEKLPVYKVLERVVYGESPIQIGYCNGHNHKLNALEYHTGCEVNIGSTDFYLILGRQQDITEDFTFDTASCKAFHVPKGVAVRVFATSLHYAPCTVEGTDGFRVIVVLPRGTNTDKPDYEPACEEDRWMTARNKWLLAHPDSNEAKHGAHIGLRGLNTDIKEDIEK